MLDGTTLRNRYKIIKLLGSGGFGETYLAEDLDIPASPKPKCVVKRLQPQIIQPEILRLFQKEGEILYRLGQNHNQIPKLYAYFQENGEFYLIQEFIEGHDLSHEISPSKPWSEAEVIKFLRQILEVLAFVHQNNVIHRDIKPANIMRRSRDGRLMLIDFGIVKEIGTLVVNSQGKTSYSIAVGTPGYMPSEQAQGKPKLSSDIYAVGMTAIQFLIGIPPRLLSEDSNGEVIWRNRASVSNRLADILTKMVRYHFSQRYQSAGEVLKALTFAIAPSPMPAATPTIKVINKTNKLLQQQTNIPSLKAVNKTNKLSRQQTNIPDVTWGWLVLSCLIYTFIGFFGGVALLAIIAGAAVIAITGAVAGAVSNAGIGAATGAVIGAAIADVFGATIEGMVGIGIFCFALAYIGAGAGQGLRESLTKFETFFILSGTSWLGLGLGWLVHFFFFR